MKNDDNIGDLGLASDFLRFEPYEFRLFMDENGEPKIMEIQDPNQDHLDFDEATFFLFSTKEDFR
jgi:hypothetical protein